MFYRLFFCVRLINSRFPPILLAQVPLLTAHSYTFAKIKTFKNIISAMPK